jgi:hypothetical protein
MNLEKVYSLGNPGNPDMIEGFYLGTKEVKNKEDGSTAKIHGFRTPKGDFGIWGKTVSNRLLAEAPTGVMTLVKATGKEKIPGGKTRCTFDIRVDRTQFIEVPNAKSSNSMAPDESDDDQETGFPPPALDENDNFDAQAEVAARRAKVQALLGKKK